MWKVCGDVKGKTETHTLDCALSILGPFLLCEYNRYRNRVIDARGYYKSMGVSFF